MLGLLDPALSPADLDRCVSKEAMLARQSAVNPRAYFSLTEDKLVFYQQCIDNDLPTPRILGIRSDRGDWPGEIPVVNDDAGWQDLLANLDVSEFVIKPIDGVHGESVMLLERSNGGFKTHADQHTDTAGILAEMQASDYSHWMMQERLHAHPDIVALSGSSNLQTARVVTWIDDSGTAQVIFAWLRIIGSGEAFDNFNFGAAGNFVATIDLDTAAVRYVLGVAPDGHGLVETSTHPSTGMDMPGFSVPHGLQMFEIAKRAAACFVPLRTVGWDVAISPDGIALVEGNVTWDPLPTKENLAAIARLK